MPDIDARLREDVHLLGELLGRAADKASFRQAA